MEFIFIWLSFLILLQIILTVIIIVNLMTGKDELQGFILLKMFRIHQRKRLLNLNPFKDKGFKKHTKMVTKV